MDLRVQMVDIFEPTMLRDGKIVIPIFFYQDGGNMYAKCTMPQVKYQPSPQSIEVEMTSDPLFDSNTLLPIQGDKFVETYLEIRIGNSVLLSVCCLNCDWGRCEVNSGRPC